MKKTILKITMLASIASLAMSGSVLAHHPSLEVVPESVLDLQNVSENHDEIVTSLMEDNDLMASTARGMDAVDSPNTTMGDGATSSQTTNQSESPTDTAPGISNAGQARTGRM